MTKKNFLLVACVAVLMFIYSFALFRIGIHYGGASTSRPQYAEEGTRYIVREYDNMIAVFEEGSDVPSRLLNINVSTLRKEDRLRFRQGIAVDSLDELAQLEEDFCS